MSDLCVKVFKTNDKYNVARRQLSPTVQTGRVQKPLDRTTEQNAKHLITSEHTVRHDAKTSSSST